MITIFKPKVLCQNKLITALQNDLLNIYPNEHLAAAITTYLGKEFNSTSLLFIQTSKGHFDLLFNNEGQLLKPGNEKLLVNIERTFEKKFVSGLINGMHCYIHSH